MNWENLLTTIVGLLGALGGWEGVKYLINRKSNKRISESEAVKKEIEADAAKFHLYEERIEELRTTNAELNKQDLELIKTGARKDEIIEAKNAEIQKLQEKEVAGIKKTAELEKQVLFYKNWFCRREYGRGKGECLRREPAQNPPLKFEPMEDD